MKIVVTGGAGYLGSILTRFLLDNGHEVRVLDSLLHGGDSLLGLYPYENFSFFNGDVRSTEVMNQVLQEAEAVVHLAAIVGDPACARQPELAKEINQDGAIQAFELSRQHGIQRFIFASTCSNYGRVTNPNQLVTEESELKPVSLYADTKVAVENSLLDVATNSSPSVTVLRFATLFGLSPRMRFDLTINEFTAELFTNRELVVYGEQFWRPYVHVRDAARAIVSVLGCPREQVDSQVFNVGDTNQNYQKGQLIDLISDQLDHEITIERVHKDEDPRDYRVSFEKVQKALGFAITRTVKDGVDEIIDAFEKGVIGNFTAPQYRN
jgi:nucleoside-diphosphate-sugar epimerase